MKVQPGTGPYTVSPSAFECGPGLEKWNHGLLLVRYLGVAGEALGLHKPHTLRSNVLHRYIVRTTEKVYLGS